MATQAVVAAQTRRVEIEKFAAFRNLRVLAWSGEILYAARGYTLLAGRASSENFSWREIGRFDPVWWRKLTCRNNLAGRLLRDGFHALAAHPSGNLIAAVPGAIATLKAGESHFSVSHRVRRGIRPLHILGTPDGQIFWGEYFDNPDRDEVHVYASDDAGCTWHVAYTFLRRSIRHIHNVIYDRWNDCLWIFTGDYGRECRILRASKDLKSVDEVIAGDQQARAVAAVTTKEGIVFATDTPLEQNYICFLDRRGRLERIRPIPSSSIYGCQNSGGIFFSTMIEPSGVNRARDVQIFGSSDGECWESLASWNKDFWPMKYFQYGNAFLPDGDNRSNLLAVTTVAVENADLQTTIFKTTATE